MHRVVHSNSEWHNMLWDDLSGCLVVIDLEDVKWFSCALKWPAFLVSESAGLRFKANHFDFIDMITDLLNDFL